MTRRYDESLQAIQEMQQAGTAVHRPDDMEFGRRLALDREIQSDEAACRSMNAVWDESGNFILYATLLGIKGQYHMGHVVMVETDILLVVNITTNKVVRLLGKEESMRWLNLSLYQGAPAKKGFVTAVSIHPV